MDKILMFFTVLAVALAAILLGSMLMAFPTMVLFNHFASALNFHEMSFSQAWAFTALITMLGTKVVSKES